MELAAFDPYHKWLGIPKEEQPPTLFQLLGISPKETDADVIEEAAIRQTTHVRAHQIGPHSEDCTRILNELSKARNTLLNPAKRKDYEEQLARKKTARGDAETGITAGRGRDLPQRQFEGLDTADDEARPRSRPGKQRPGLESGLTKTPDSSGNSKALLVAVGVGGSVIAVGLAVFFLFFQPAAPPPQDPPQIVQAKKELKPVPPPKLDVPEPPKVEPVPPVPLPKPKEFPQKIEPSKLDPPKFEPKVVVPLPGALAKGLLVFKTTATLGPEDPKDNPSRPNVPYKTYRVSLSAGKAYAIEMNATEKGKLDPYLVVHNPAKQKVAEDDDSGGNLNARIVYAPPCRAFTKSSPLL